MLGLVMEGPNYALQRQSFGGALFLALTLPRDRLRRELSLRRGIRGLQKKGVHRCVFPEGFRQREWFASRGVAGMDVEALLRKKAGEWVLAERQARGLSGSVAIRADRLDGDIERAVRLLLEKLGSVSLTKVGGAEELQREIRRQSGAVLRLITADRLSAAETVLNLSASTAEGQKLTLRPGMSEEPCFLLPQSWRGLFPPDIDSGELAAALTELGKVKAESIGLKSRM